MRDLNILIGRARLHGNVWKIRPPLCFDRSHADMFLEDFDKVLAATG